MVIYILKFSACLALFLAFYKLFLEKENMHVFKRFYLLGALLLAIGIPLVTFTYYIEPIAQVIPEIIQEIPIDYSVELAVPETNYLPIILWSIYGLGVLLFGFKFMRNLYGISYKIKHNPKQKANKITNVLLQDLIVPHTFFNFIFFNKQKFEAQEIPKEVLLHEETHAMQKHSIDVVFIEVLQVLFWFNPLLYIIKHLIKLNHEFLADQAVINKGIETATYQQTLLAFSSNAAQPQLASAINYSLIKKRFTVMKTQTSKKAIWLRSLVLLPLLAITLYSFSDTITVERETPDTKYFEINNTGFQDDITVTEDISIRINKKGQLLVNDNLVPIDELLNELQKHNNSITIEDRDLIKISIIPEVETPMGVVSDVKQIINDYGVPKIVMDKWVYLKLQQKATKEQIAEYNKLAKKYNDMPKDDMIIRKDDIKRLKYLYTLMSDDQKKNAEAFPNIPVPPAPLAVKVVNSNSPPPPPLPANATEAQKIKYKEAYQEARVAAKVLKLKAQKERAVQVREIRSDEDRKRLKEVKLAQRETQVAARVLKLKSQKERAVQVREIRSVKLKEEKLAQRETQVAAKVLKLKAQKGELVKIREIRSVKLKEERLAQRETQVAAKVLKLKAQKKALVEVRKIQTVKLREEKKVHRESQAAARVLKLKAQKEKLIKVRELMPPPPPLPKNATKAQKRKYEEAVKKYKLQRTMKAKDGKTLKIKDVPPPPPIPKMATVQERAVMTEVTEAYYNENASEVEIIEVPEVVEFVEVEPIEEVYVEEIMEAPGIVEVIEVLPPPPPPKSPLEHIKDMAKKGAEFYYDGKSISSSKAIKLIRSNKNMSIMTNHTSDTNFVVTLSTKPIVIKD